MTPDQIPSSQHELINQFVSNVNEIESIVSWQLKQSVQMAKSERSLSLKKEINQTQEQQIKPEDKLNLNGKLSEEEVAKFGAG